MSMVNEAEAVNAQRDAQRAREMDTILDTSVRLGAYTFSDALWPQNATTLNADVKKFTANIYRNLNATYEVGHPIAKEWEQPDLITSPVRSLHEMGRGKVLDLRDDALTLATLRGDAWRAQAVKAETERDAARAEAARHAGRLIVACEERDTAYAQRDLWQAIVSQAARRTLRGRVWAYIRRGKR